MQFAMDARLILPQMTGIGRYLMGLISGMRAVCYPDRGQIWLQARSARRTSSVADGRRVTELETPACTPHGLARSMGPATMDTEGITRSGALSAY